VSTVIDSPARAAADESRPGPEKEDAAAAEFVDLDGLAVDELRAQPPELLRILSATGC
jgi:hypothetical protein